MNWIFQYCASWSLSIFLFHIPFLFILDKHSVLHLEWLTKTIWCIKLVCWKLHLQIVHVTLDNYDLEPVGEDDDKRGETHHNWVDEVVRCEGRSVAGVGSAISSCTILRPRAEKKDPSLLSRFKSLSFVPSHSYLLCLLFHYLFWIYPLQRGDWDTKSLGTYMYSKNGWTGQREYNNATGIRSDVCLLWYQAALGS